MSLLTASLFRVAVSTLTITPPGNHRQREDLRQDRQRLEQLRQRRDQKIREGDKHEAREYNEKIQDQKREIRRDQKKYIWKP